MLGKIKNLYYTRLMKTYETIFNLLYNHKQFLTGEELAKQLGISRTAVWKAIKTLEEQGITIKTLKGKGYRWISGDLLIPETITDDTGIQVSYSKKSTSTQLDARQGMDLGNTAPMLYLAPHQTAARGRLGRQFYAQENGGVYMSLHLKPNVAINELPAYTLMVAAAVVKAISRLTGKNADIKWVNDIYLNGKKIAGILTEAITSIETGLITDVIIGVGINVKLTDIPEELKDKVSSLFENEEPTITRNQLINEIWNLFFLIPENELFKVYRDKSIVLGRQVSFSQSGKEYTGLVNDITSTGELLLTLSNGEKMSLSSGEVSLKSW